MIKRLVTLYIITLSFFSLTARPAFAVNVPDFGSCLNPQGTLVRQYDSGTHGVPGRTDQYEGSDAVYMLSDSAIAQCLCPNNGNGVQTNWLKASNLSQADIDVLKHEGWIYIATGTPWGLEDVPYLAKNKEYSCATSSVAGASASTTTPGATATPTPEVRKVLGLAATGNLLFLYGLILAGSTSLIFGMILNTLRRKK